MALNKPAAPATAETKTKKAATSKKVASNNQTYKPADCWIQLSLEDSTKKLHGFKKNYAGYTDQDSVVAAMKRKEEAHQEAYRTKYAKELAAGTAPAYEPFMFTMKVWVNIPQEKTEEEIVL